MLRETQRNQRKVDTNLEADNAIEITINEQLSSLKQLPLQVLSESLQISYILLHQLKFFSPKYQK